MQRTAQLYAGYANELKCLPEFIALMLRDIADTFEENALDSKKIVTVAEKPLISKALSKLS